MACMLFLRTSIKLSSHWLASCMSSCSVTPPLLRCARVLCSSSFAQIQWRLPPASVPLLVSFFLASSIDLPCCFQLACRRLRFHPITSQLLLTAALDSVLDPTTASVQGCHLTIIEILFHSLLLRMIPQIAVLSHYMLIPRSLRCRQHANRPRSLSLSLLPNTIRKQTAILLPWILICCSLQRCLTPNSPRILLLNVAHHAFALSFLGRPLPRWHPHRILPTLRL